MRLQSELEALFPAEAKKQQVKVHTAPAERRYLPWVGGAKLAL